MAELYELDPADFVSARNDLARSLRKEGQRDLATRVAELRRPSPAAWAVNQLAYRHRAELDGLLRLGDALRLAQAQALAGADAAELRDAGRVRRQAVASLTDAAVSFLTERGQGAATHHTEIAATLEAASLDPEAGAEVSGGQLTTALEPPSGFGDLDPDFDQPRAEAPPPVAGVRPVPTETHPPTAETTAMLAEAERAASDAARRASDLSEKARQAAVLAARRNQEVAEAEADEARLQRDLDLARGRVAAGRRSAERAQNAAESAEAKAADAGEQRRDAERRVLDLRAHNPLT